MRMQGYFKSSLILVSYNLLYERVSQGCNLFASILLFQMVTILLSYYSCYAKKDRWEVAVVCVLNVLTNSLETTFCDVLGNVVFCMRAVVGSYIYKNFCKIVG